MQIGLISPTFPPDRCGVGDHSLQIKLELESRGHQVVRMSVLPDASQAREFKLLILQYTPSLWAKNILKLNPELIRWCKSTIKDTKLILMAHELHYPFQFTLRGLTIGLGQKLQFEHLVKSVDWTFFSYEAAQSRFPKRSEVLPVGTTIPVTHHRKYDSSSKKHITLLHFGGNHPTHLIAWTLHALRAVRLKFSNHSVELLWIGLNEKDKDNILNDFPQGNELRPFVRAAGYLGEEQASEEMTKVDLALAPFMDGVSTRRTSFMAEIAHGIPTVTTRGWATHPNIPWEKFCQITPVELEPFIQATTELLENPTRLSELRTSSRSAYEELFSWKKIGHQLDQRIKTLGDFA